MFLQMQTTVFLAIVIGIGISTNNAWADACDRKRSEHESTCLSKEIRKPNQKKADFSYRNRCEASAAVAYRKCQASMQGAGGCDASKKFIETLTTDGGNLYHKFDEYRRGGLDFYQATLKSASVDAGAQNNLLKCKSWAKSFLKRVAPNDACKAARKQIDHILNHNLAAREAFDNSRQNGQTTWIAMQPEIAKLPKGPENISTCGGWAPVYLTRNVSPMIAIILPNALKKKKKSE